MKKTFGCVGAALAASLALAGAPTCHVVGGTDAFRSFLHAVGEGMLKTYASIEELPLGTAGEKDAFFILPDYAHGRQAADELSFGRLAELGGAADRGAGFYFENYVVPENVCDGLRADLTGLQVFGRPRHFYQESLVTERDEVLQARDAYYLPCFAHTPHLLATVRDCVGTHRVSRPGTVCYPVLAQGRTRRIVSAAFDLSRFDPLCRRPRREWRMLLVETVSSVTGAARDRVGAAFEATYPEPLRLGGGTVGAAARRAVDWHFRSGVMPSSDGRAGVFEMIRSDDFGVRRVLRTDSALLTAALLASAGRTYGNEAWSRAGRNIADYLLARGVQDASGLFRWSVGSDTVYASDCSRDGLALVNLHKATGESRYRESAVRLGDALVSWLGTNDVCCGRLSLENGCGGRELSDNPVYYGEMVPFLLRLGTARHVAAAERVVARVMAKFPDVKPFGYSDNFTYSRALLMLACAQSMTDRDWSAKINLMLDFFVRLRHPCGGLREAPIRIEAEGWGEAGVAMGDGSDAITDILYCDYVVYGAATVLARLPEARRGRVDLAKARLLAEGLRDFFVKTQIVSDDARFDGGWMRAFDMDRNEYYGLNRDMIWGSYGIMGGWVMGFVPALLMNEGTNECWFAK